jgi:hypothetical protein
MAGHGKSLHFCMEVSRRRQQQQSGNAPFKGSYFKRQTDKKPPGRGCQFYKVLFMSRAKCISMLLQFSFEKSHVGSGENFISASQSLSSRRNIKTCKRPAICFCIGGTNHMPCLTLGAAWPGKSTMDNILAICLILKKMMDLTKCEAQ